MIKEAAQIAVSFAPVFLAGVFPFMRVVRGGSKKRAFFLCWVLLIVWMIVFSLIIPLVAGLFGREVVKSILHWVPEMRGILPIMSFGWLYAGVTVLLALITRSISKWIKRKDAKCAALPNNVG